MDKVYTDEQRVYYADTDSYGVLWHGSSVKWFEKGRIELYEMYGLSLKETEEKGIVFPVVDLNIRYKASALVNDIIIIETKIEEIRNSSIVFSHIVKNKLTQQTLIIATSTIVAMNFNNKKMFRKFPEEIIKYFK